MFPDYKPEKNQKNQVRLANIMTPFLSMLLFSSCLQGMAGINQVSDCEPKKGYQYCIEISVLIDEEPENVFRYVENIYNHTKFFPKYEFKAEGENGMLRDGLVYYVLDKRNKKAEWIPYKIIGFSKNQFYSGELIGKDKIFKKLLYEHYFIARDGKTLSVERIHYTLNYGFLNGIINFLIARKTIINIVLNAHLRLKSEIEKARDSEGK